MKVEILRYVEDEKNMRIGFVDFKVYHTPDKWEIWRKEPVFQKGDRMWVNITNVLIDDKWLPKYERSTDVKEIYKLAGNELKEWLKKANQKVSVQEEIPMPSDDEIPKNDIDWM